MGALQVVTILLRLLRRCCQEKWGARRQRPLAGSPHGRSCDRTVTTVTPSRRWGAGRLITAVTGRGLVLVLGRSTRARNLGRPLLGRS
jgi:hypothetical protein